MADNYTILDKLEKVSAEECRDLHRLPYDMLGGHCAVVFDKVGIPHTNPIPEEYFDAVIDGIIDEIYDGIEPEFETEEEYDRYEAAITKLKKYQFVTETYATDNCCGRQYVKGPHSSYKDKTIPFLAYVE